MQKLSKTLEAASISKEKELKPFWNEQCQELSSELLLPTVTDLADSLLTYCSGLSKGQEGASWFLIQQNIHQSKSLPKTYLASCMSLAVGCTDYEAIATKIIKLYPTKPQNKILKKWTDCSRYVFNQSIAYMRTCINFNPSWMDVRKDLLNNCLPSWCDDVPYQIKGWAVKLAHQSYWATIKAHKVGSGAIIFNFKSRKEPEQSCYITTSALKKSGIYPRISGKGLHYSEPLPETIKDSRLIWKYGSWWIAIPNTVTLTSSENQGSSIVALDPGIRTFISFYSPHCSGKIGVNAQKYKYYLAMDNLISKRDSCKNNKQKRSYSKAIKRLRQRVTDLVDELHWKTARYLCESFDVILMPTFETSQMSNKSKRQIGSKTVRAMMGFGFYKFTQRLKWMALKLGKKVISVSEEYTSKTHPETGVINQKLGGAKTIKLLNGSRADRDIVGGFNILLKFLVGDTPVLSTQDI